MTAATQDIFVRIAADASRYRRDMLGARGATTGFAQHAKAEFGRLRAYLGSMQGQLMGLGAGYGAVQLAKDSARLQKETQLLKVATGGSREEMERWRNEMYQQQQITGTTVNQQLELSQALQAAGMGMGSITTTLEPASRAMAVAKANADQLGRAMGVAHEQFDIDLTNKDAVTQMLDQMVVAGRLGNAELENLPDIFARVGGRAREANMGMTDTLAIVETLSKSEPQAERLSTLVDSTLRVFTNAKYMKDAAKATGVQFFNSDGSRRDPLVVLQEMHTRYQQLHSDAERMQFINKAFGKADMDTMRGMMKLLGGDTLNMLEQYKRDIQNAGGQIGKDLAEAINNSVDQVSRLGGALREAVDKGFTDPLNDALNSGIKYLMNPTEESNRRTHKRGEEETVEEYDKRIAELNSGLGLSGGEMLASAAGLAAVVYGASRIPGVVGKYAGKAADIAQGTATGVALQKSMGIQPVYVVNMADAAIAGANPVDGAGGVGVPPVVAGGGKYARWARMGGAFAIGGFTAYDTYEHAKNLYEGNGDNRQNSIDKWAIAGAGTGAVAGGIIGSIVPIIGTALGAAAGAWLGQKAGEFIGEKNVQPVIPPDWLVERASIDWDRRYQFKADGYGFYQPGVKPVENYTYPKIELIAGANLTESAAKWGGEIAQQNAQAVNTIMLAGVAQQQAIQSTLIGQLNATKIMGNIAVTVSPSSELLNVRTAVIPGNANTQMTANVGRTGGPAS